jgi:hypothetical protein
MSTYHGSVSILDHPLGMNGTYYRWDADLLVRYTVLSEGWHNFIFQFCGTDKAAMPIGGCFRAYCRSGRQLLSLK